ncbi:MAG TPA: site-specific integrase [Gammaproteobacteria bacterium]
MGRKRTPGLVKRSGIWHIDKEILGKRVCRSTRTSNLAEAERSLAAVISQRRDAVLHGDRPQRTFSKALARYCRERDWNKTDVYHCDLLDAALGHLDVSEVHMGALQGYIENRLKTVKKKTVNLSLDVVRAVLKRAAGEWIDENGLTWLHHAPTIKSLYVDDKAKPYPLSWEEERILFPLLPPRYQAPALYVVNTGLRDQVACRLEWKWERQVPEIGRSVFVVPGHVTGVKNGQEWVVVHNRTAQTVIDAQRGKHERFVFPGRGDKGRLHRINNKGWREAWKDAGLPTSKEYSKGPHNLRRTFSTRLRAMGVPDETRDYLMHHKREGDMSALYSIPTLRELVAAVDKLCEGQTTGATVLRLVG